MDRTSLATLLAGPLLGGATLLFTPSTYADFQRNFDARLSRAQEVVPSGPSNGGGMTTPVPTTPGSTTQPTPSPLPGESGSDNSQQFVPADIQGGGNANFAIQFSTGLNRAGYLLNINNVQNVTQAHLHCGRAGENGPVVVSLLGNNTRNQSVNRVIRNEDVAMNVDCRSIIGRQINNLASLLAAINEGLVYVNVHTQQYPDGFVRGQLFPGAEWSTLGFGNNSDDVNGESPTPTPSRTGG